MAVLYIFSILLINPHIYNCYWSTQLYIINIFISADSSRSDIIRVQQTGISLITIILTAYLLQQRLL